MDRRNFIKKSLVTTTTFPLVNSTFSAADETPNRNNNNKILNAYYFRAHMYTIVPEQVEFDMKWMADQGTNAVSVALLEQDMWAAVENINIIAEKAGKYGIDLFIVPSRWGGLTAGAPKVPSMFSVLNPHTWMLKEDGEPYNPSKTSGVISSIHYEETYEFFVETLERAFEYWPVKGVVWDEPKAYGKIDHSEMAKKNLPANAGVEIHDQAFSDFFSRVNTAIKKKNPDVLTNMFIQVFEQDHLESSAKIRDLDYFGCDGKPWNAEIDEKFDGKGKYLLGQMDYFFELAKKNGKKTLVLAENHNMEHKKTAYIAKNLPKVVEANPDHLIYYYYPRNVERPNAQMEAVAKGLKGYM